MEYFRKVPSKPVWTPEESSYGEMLASIAQEWKIIRDEAETALELGKGFKYALNVTQYLDADIL